MGASPGKTKTGGRKKGTPNRVTPEERGQIRTIAKELLSPEYWDAVRVRMLKGTMAPAVEARIIAYAYGEPMKELELSGDVGIVATTVIHEHRP